MTSTVRCIRAELRKLFTARTFPGALALAVGLALVSVVVDVAVAGKNGAAPLGSVANIHQILKMGSVTCVAMLVVGIVSSGGEYHHHTIVPSVLASPRRASIVVAKAVAVGAAGMVLSAVTFGLGVGTAVAMLSAHGIHHLAGDTPRLFIGAVVASTLFGLIGVALGFIARSTIAAAVGAVGWALFVELAILHNLIPHLAKWLPTAAAVGLTDATVRHADSLTPGLAAAVLGAYSVVLLVAAAQTVLRRDIA
jgi:ABC-2 type transport system permease protein